MTTKNCPLCSTEIHGDPQHCPCCQNGLRGARLNKVGRFVMFVLPASLVVLVIVLINLFLQVPDILGQTASEWGFLALKIASAIAGWFAFFWLIGQLEFLVTTE